MKKLISLALALTFVFVGANAAFAAPDQPPGHADMDATECVTCHTPESTTKAAAHSNPGHEGAMANCNSCHGPNGPGVAGEDVDCGVCHTTVPRTSWEKTYQEDSDTSTIVSDDEVAGDALGHHLNEDGTQKPCTDCHVNRAFTDSDGDGTMDDVDSDMDGDGLEGEADLNPTYVDVCYTSYDSVYTGNIMTDELVLADGATIEMPTYDPTNVNSKVQTQPMNGTVTFDYATGDWTYVPNHDHSSTLATTDSFVLRGYDTNGDRYYVNITVTDEAAPIEEPPVEEPPVEKPPVEEPPAPVEETPVTEASSTNPKTGGTAGLALSVGFTTMSAAGLVVLRKRK